MKEPFYAIKSVASPIRVGMRVRLRNVPDDTGVVIDRGFQPQDVKVRWDSDDALTYIQMRRLEPVP